MSKSKGRGDAAKMQELMLFEESAYHEEPFGSCPRYRAGSAFILDKQFATKRWNENRHRLKRPSRISLWYRFNRHPIRSPLTTRLVQVQFSLLRNAISSGLSSWQAVIAHSWHQSQTLGGMNRINLLGVWHQPKFIKDLLWHRVDNLMKLLVWYWFCKRH